MTGKKRHFASRMGRWSANHPWWAVLVWLLLTVVAFSIGTVVKGREATNQELLVGQAATADRIVNENGLRGPATENVLVGPLDGRLDDASAAAAAELKQQLGALDGVASVSDPIPSADQRVLLLQVAVKGDPDTANDRVAPLLAATRAVQQAHPDLRVEEVGEASIKSDFQDWLGKDLQKATTISVPVTLVILALIFGAVVMAGVPVLLGLTAVASTLGLWALASQVVPDPGTVTDVIVLMGLAVGVDYCLFYLRRFREETAKGYGATSAVEIAAATSGHSVVVSGVAVLVSMAGLYLAGDLMLASMATGAIIVVAVAMLSAVTVLPALLVKLGRAVDRPRIPLVWRLTRSRSNPRAWNFLLRPATRHPLVSLVLAVGALVALALPALGMDLKATQIADYPRTLATMQSYDRLLAEFPSNANTDVVAVKTPAGQQEAVRGRLERLAEQLGQEPLFAKDIPPAVRVSADGRGAVLEAGTPTPPGTSPARDSVDRLRDVLVPAALKDLPGVEYAVGGDQADDMDYTANLKDRLPMVMGVVFALTFLIIVLAFRSVVVALTTVVLNLLSVAASFGFLCLVFQHTWADGLLDYHSTGHVVSWVPVLLFVILSGLSLDYHVFVVSRIREGVVAGMTTRNAVLDGITRTAGVVTGAAAVMVAVFATFGTLTFIELKQIGVGLAVAIVLDATVIRIFVLPAAMTLLGRANWWPSRTGRAVTADLPRRSDGAHQEPVDV
ncbi:MMPL family transporter [Kitasatospora fiedleri]|uniref:MMPL family transporter n=1 Tax=Kitasatospora fiedleri TaxID=2991545 RepID=UPI00249C65C8|nr:MMPL family transporter [Kitasatospora fiedleri]